MTPWLLKSASGSENYSIILKPPRTSWKENARHYEQMIVHFSELLLNCCHYFTKYNVSAQSHTVWGQKDLTFESLGFMQNSPSKLKDMASQKLGSFKICLSVCKFEHALYYFFGCHPISYHICLGLLRYDFHSCLSSAARLRRFPRVSTAAFLQKLCFWKLIGLKTFKNDNF